MSRSPDHRRRRWYGRRRGHLTVRDHRKRQYERLGQASTILAVVDQVPDSNRVSLCRDGGHVPLGCARDCDGYPIGHGTAGPLGLKKSDRHSIGQRVVIRTSLGTQTTDEVERDWRCPRTFVADR